MKTLTKLALVSAMAFSSSVMAMQALDDETLSAATGQDGITITLTGGITFDQLAIHDNGGLTSISGDTGAIVLGQITAAEADDGTAAGSAFSLATGGLDIVIDADGNGGAPVLNVAMDFGNAVLDIGSIFVAASDFDGANAATSSVSNAKSAIDIGSITLNGLTVNVQLGTQDQGALIALNSSVTGGVSIASLGLISNAEAGNTPDGTYGNRNSTAITLGGLNVRSNGSADLNLALNIDPSSEGLYINGLTALDISANSVDLGNSASIGGLSIKNLSVGDILVKGH